MAAAIPAIAQFVATAVISTVVSKAVTEITGNETLGMIAGMAAGMGVNAGLNANSFAGAEATVTPGTETVVSSATTPAEAGSFFDGMGATDTMTSTSMSPVDVGLATTSPAPVQANAIFNASPSATATLNPIMSPNLPADQMHAISKGIGFMGTDQVVKPTVNPVTETSPSSEIKQHMSAKRSNTNTGSQGNTIRTNPGADTALGGEGAGDWLDKEYWVGNQDKGIGGVLQTAKGTPTFMGQTLASVGAGLPGLLVNNDPYASIVAQKDRDRAETQGFLDSGGLKSAPTRFSKPRQPFNYRGRMTAKNSLYNQGQV